MCQKNPIRGRRDDFAAIRHGFWIQFTGMAEAHFADVYEGESGSAVALKVFSKSAAMVMISSKEGVSPKNMGPSMAA